MLQYVRLNAITNPSVVRNVGAPYSLEIA